MVFSWMSLRECMTDVILFSPFPLYWARWRPVNIRKRSASWGQQCWTIQLFEPTLWEVTIPFKQPHSLKAFLCKHNMNLMDSWLEQFQKYNNRSVQNRLRLTQPPTFLAEQAFANRHIICLWAETANLTKSRISKLFIHLGGAYFVIVYNEMRREPMR